jgi:hypothetical protein
MRPPPIFLLWLTALLATLAPAARAAEADSPEITINTNFEGGSLGRVEKLSATTFRLHVAGQHDHRGRNRQASWYYFRLDHVKGRQLQLTLTDLVGEYNDRPGSVPAGPDILPVFSHDQQSWKHFETGQWDNTKKEMTLTIRPTSDTLWIAHIPPYTPADLARLLDDARKHPHALVEVIGQSARGRHMHQLTITDPDAPDEVKKQLFIMARQHAWEAGTSHVAQGAVRFLLSDEAKALRRENVFRIVPMVDVDGCAEGKVRFNANGYDVNRHWDAVDLRRPELLQKMPEIWYAKKTILAAHAKRPIDLLINLHNTETNEYLETHAKDPKSVAAIRKLHDLLVKNTAFDPSKDLAVRDTPTSTTNSLAPQHGVPVALMELRIGTTRKVARRPTEEDRLTFGRDLVTAMAEAAK